MDARLNGKFVVDSSSLREVDSLISLQDMILTSVGMSGNNGRTLEVTVAVKTTTDKAWVRCDQLGYYRSEPCNRLIPPGTKCPEDHYHSPAWETPTDTLDPICTTCQALGIEPSRAFDASEYYNHKGAPPK